MRGREEELKQQLIADIERLEAENMQIAYDIDKIEQKDERIRARHIVGENIKKLYWRIPVKFIDSVFYTRREEIAKENEVCMLPELMRHFKTLPFAGQTREVFHMAVLCEDIIETPEGYRLALRDPYQRVLSNALEIDAETAYSMKGKILYIDCMESDECDIFIKRWKITPLTLHGYREERDQVKNTIASALLDVKDIHSEEEAISAVTALQNYYRIKEENIKLARISPTEIRILKHIGGNMAILYGIMFLNGEFWLCEEPNHEFISKELGDVMKEINECLCLKDSRELRSRKRWTFKYIDEEVLKEDY